MEEDEEEEEERKEKERKEEERKVEERRERKMMSSFSLTDTHSAMSLWFI